MTSMSQNYKIPYHPLLFLYFYLTLSLPLLLDLDLDPLPHPLTYAPPFFLCFPLRRLLMDHWT
jgi:hypothetical protein